MHLMHERLHTFVLKSLKMFIMGQQIIPRISPKIEIPFMVYYFFNKLILLKIIPFDRMTVLSGNKARKDSVQISLFKAAALCSAWSVEILDQNEQAWHRECGQVDQG